MVRQNSVLRWALTLLVIFAVLSVVVLTTMMEVRVVRKAAVRGEVHHHLEEHSAQVKLMQVHLSLQRQLELQLQERDAADSHRVRLMKLVDTELSAVEALVGTGGITPEVALVLTGKALPAMRAKIQFEVDASVHKSQKRGAAARDSISEVAKQIIADVQLDADEMKRYHDAMAALGTNEDFYADYDLDEDGKLEEAKLEYELEAFFKALEKRPLPEATPEQIKAMEAYIEKAFATMEDETKEVDEALLLKQFGEVVKDVTNVVPYFEAVHKNVLDYMEMLVEQAKVAPHLQELTDLHDGWLSGEDPKTPRQCQAPLALKLQKTFPWHAGGRTLPTSPPPSRVV